MATTDGDPMVPQELSRNLADQADQAEAAGHHVLAKSLRAKAADAWTTAQPTPYHHDHHESKGA